MTGHDMSVAKGNVKGMGTMADGYAAVSSASIIVVDLAV